MFPPTYLAILLKIYNRRFLYVTFHPWPILAATRQAASPNLLPLCSGLDCAIIDLATFETVGRLDNAQTGLLSNKATAESVLPSISRKVTFVPKLGSCNSRQAIS